MSSITPSLDGYIADENGNFDWAQPSEDAAPSSSITASDDHTGP